MLWIIYNKKEDLPTIPYNDQGLRKLIRPFLKMTSLIFHIHTNIHIFSASFPYDI